MTVKQQITNPSIDSFMKLIFNFRQLGHNMKLKNVSDCRKVLSTPCLNNYSGNKLKSLHLKLARFCII